MSSKPVPLLLQNVALLLAVTGCASTVTVYEFQNDSELDQVYIEEGVDFSRYHSVVIDPISVWYPTDATPTGEAAERSRQNLARAQELFRSSIGEALGERYPVVSSAAEGVLRVHVEFVDLRMLEDGEPVPERFRRLAFDSAPGRITLVAELQDSLNGEVLARAADLGKRRSRGGGGVVDWEAIADDFDYWSTVFAAFMARVHGQR